MSLGEYPVRSCTGKLAFISGSDDFSLEAGRAVDSSRMFDPDVSPYCFDLANRALLCVSTPDISGATFFYQAQRQHARSVIQVPFDSLPEETDSPALIFSIGRCGSTLLVRALQAAGVRTVSEPDFYTQVACHQPLDVALRRVIAGATRLLPYSVIKLRLECNNAPLLISGAFSSPRIMFILRDPVDWAASLRRLSRNSLDLGWAVGQLGRSLLALDQLTRNHAVRICYYEDFRSLDRAPLRMCSRGPAGRNRSRRKHCSRSRPGMRRKERSYRGHRCAMFRRTSRSGTLSGVNGRGYALSS